jgi:hypothetical protein
MDLVDTMTVIAEFEHKMALDEVVPQRRLGRGEILSQKSNQKIFTNHEVSDLIPL